MRAFVPAPPLSGRTRARARPPESRRRRPRAAPRAALRAPHERVVVELARPLGVVLKESAAGRRVVVDEVEDSGCAAGLVQPGDIVVEASASDGGETWPERSLDGAVNAIKNRNGESVTLTLERYHAEDAQDEATAAPKGGFYAGALPSAQKGSPSAPGVGNSGVPNAAGVTAVVVDENSLLAAAREAAEAVPAKAPFAGEGSAPVVAANSKATMAARENAAVTTGEKNRTSALPKKGSSKVVSSVVGDCATRERIMIEVAPPLGLVLQEAARGKRVVVAEVDVAGRAAGLVKQGDVVVEISTPGGETWPSRGLEGAVSAITSGGDTVTLVLERNDAKMVRVPTAMPKGVRARSRPLVEEKIQAEADALDWEGEWWIKDAEKDGRSAELGSTVWADGTKAGEGEKEEPVEEKKFEEFLQLILLFPILLLLLPQF